MGIDLKNVLVIANSGSLQNVYVEQVDGQAVIKRTGLFRRHCLNDEQKVREVIAHSICRLRSLISTEGGEYNDLFLAAQRYNQVVLKQGLGLPQVKINEFPELAPLFLRSMDPRKIVEDQALQIIERNGRYYYDDEDSRISHSIEAMRIFFSTQIERILSVGDRIFSGIFPFLKKYHYLYGNDSIYQHHRPLSANPTQPTSYWIGHATCLMHFPFKSSDNQRLAVNILTDPIEGDLNPLLYPRMTHPARTIEECPPVHVLLISHNHRDHFDLNAIKKLLPQQPVVIVPKGDKETLRAMGFRDVREVSWWDEIPIHIEQGSKKLDFTITAAPSHHWSGRGFFDANRSAFVGYVIRGPGITGDVYFAGDTARLSAPLINEMRNRFDIRTIFQPGGPDEKRRDMKSSHQCSADGLVVFCQLLLQKLVKKARPATLEDLINQAKELKLIYMHNKTFKLGCLHFDDTDRSIERVFRVLEQNQDAAGDLKPYERDVYEQLLICWRQISQDLQFPFSINDFAQLLRKITVIPQIGERTIINVNPVLSSKKWCILFASTPEIFDMINPYRNP